MKAEIKKTTVETFNIEADGQASLNYAKEMVLRGDYAFKISLDGTIKGDGYSITRHRDYNLEYDISKT